MSENNKTLHIGVEQLSSLQPEIFSTAKKIDQFEQEIKLYREKIVEVLEAIAHVESSYAKLQEECIKKGFKVAYEGFKGALEMLPAKRLEVAKMIVDKINKGMTISKKEIEFLEKTAKDIKTAGGFFLATLAISIAGTVFDFFYNRKKANEKKAALFREIRTLNEKAEEVKSRYHRDVETIALTVQNRMNELHAYKSKIEKEIPNSFAESKQKILEEINSKIEKYKKIYEESILVLDYFANLKPFRLLD